MDKNEKLKKIEEESRRIFLFEFREKINEVLIQILNFRIGYNVKDKNEIRRFFHSIKGSAGIHGYKALSHIGAEYEELLESVRVANDATHKFYSKLLEGVALVYEILNEEYKKTKPLNSDWESDEDKDEIENFNKRFINNDYLCTLGNGAILIVDDDISLLNILDKYLTSNGYNVIIISRPIDVIEIIRVKCIDLVLLDINMPEVDGFELFYKIKEKSPSTKVFFLTANSSMDSKMKAFDMGADDYIIKPFEIKELEARIRNIIKENKNVKRKLYIDKITGAFSKDLFYDNFEIAKSNYQNNLENFCIALLDIDSFRDINIYHGYNNGDYILQTFYNKAKEVFVNDEQIYRIYGDKFLVLFSKTKPKDAFYKIDLLRKELKLFKIDKKELANVKIKFSAGIVGTRENYSMEINVFEMIDFAEEALAAAKDDSRNSIVIYKYKEVDKVTGNDENDSLNKKAKIVIIEDSKNIVNLIKKRLEELDYEVMHSYDGGTGLTICMAAKPDILILDLMLPTMDGFEICKILKENDETKNIAIIVMTSYNKKEYVVNCMKMGVEGFIVKPFSLQELEMRINKILEN